MPYMHSGFYHPDLHSSFEVSSYNDFQPPVNHHVRTRDASISTRVNIQLCARSFQTLSLLPFCLDYRLLLNYITPASKKQQISIPEAFASSWDPSVKRARHMCGYIFLANGHCTDCTEHSDKHKRQVPPRQV
jgi:hypothetical protein